MGRGEDKRAEEQLREEKSGEVKRGEESRSGSVYTECRDNIIINFKNGDYN